MPISQVIQRMRERGHVVGASLLAKWSWAVSFAVSAVVFALIDHPSGLAAFAGYFGVLIALAYWLSEAWFLRRRWERESADHRMSR